MRARRAPLAAWLVWAAVWAAEPARLDQQQPANNEKPFASLASRAVLNGVASLACDIQPASADDSVALVLWYKDDSLAPIYTVDARKVSSLDRAKISFDEQYSSRIHFKLKSRPALLQLSNVRPEDEADYRCRVDFRRGRTVNTIIALQIVVPPTELAIYQAGAAGPGGRLDGLIGPFNEGDQLELVCQASGGKPRPQITWRRDFNVISSTQQTVDKEGTSAALRIAPLNKSHLLSIFTCQATNSNLTSPLQSSITLDLNLKPQEISLRQLNADQEPLLVGQTVTFECATHGSRPQATIHWLFQSVRHDTPMNVDQQQTSARLSLTLQRSFNQQLLTCVAENPRIAASNSPSAASKQTSLRLDVQYAPQLSIRLEPQRRAHRHQQQPANGSSAGPEQQEGAPGPLHPGGSNRHDDEPNQDDQEPGEAAQRVGAPPGNQLQEGNDIYLTCQLDANPRPPKPVQWRFNGRLLSGGSLAGFREPQAVVVADQSLVLRKVSRHQSGAYSCEAANSLGLNSSGPLQLDIRHAPVCAHANEVHLLEVRLGETLDIECRIRANPGRASFSWFASSAGRPAGAGEQLAWTLAQAAADSEAQFEQIDESGARLRFRVAGERDLSRLIKCKAKNEIGLQQRPCLFQLAPGRPPAGLSHSCALAAGAPSSRADELQVSCRQNEHLKTSESELAGGPRQSVGPSGWPAQLEAPAGQLRRKLPADSEPGAVRLVHPPAWLLVELFAKPADEQQRQDELAAYVVVGAASQLSRIKSLVEDNKLFRAQPRDVYYVAARPAQLQATRPTLATEADASASVGGAIEQDDAVRLPGEFNFTIPSLRPATKYRLLVYGQNLVNRTRDWLALRAETPAGDEASSPGRLAAPAANSPDESSSAAPSTGAGSLDSAQRDQPSPDAPAKSISMRSELNAPARGEQPPSDEAAPRTFASASLNFPLNHLSRDSLDRQLKQLAYYKDFAISYARQKPLLVIPLALGSLALLAVVAIWFSVSLAKLMRANGRRRSPSGELNDSPSGAGKQLDPDKQQAQQLSGSESAATTTNGDDSYTSSTTANHCDEANELLGVVGSAKGQPGSPSLGRAQHLSALLLPDDHEGGPFLGGHSFLVEAGQRAHQPADRRTIYAIDHQSSLLDAIALEQIYNNRSCLLPNTAGAAHHHHQQQQQQHQHQTQHQQFVGSLDRRLFAGGEHYFVASELQTAGEGRYGLQFVDQHDACHLNRPRGFRRPKVEPRDSAPAAANAAERDTIGHHNQANSETNTNFSSTECSSSASSKLAHRVHAGRRSHVAFDLSNNGLPELDDRAQAGSRQHQRAQDAASRLNPQQQQQAIYSNHLAGPDSGHESPATNELNSCNSSLRNDRHQAAGADYATAPKSARLLAAESRCAQHGQPPGASRCCDPNGPASLLVDCAERPGSGAKVLMLMELSPGSQESQSTLLQSVDSLEPTLEQHQHQHLLLNQNHQMATSFAKTNGCVIGWPPATADSREPFAR